MEESSVHTTSKALLALALAAALAACADDGAVTGLRENPGAPAGTPSAGGVTGEHVVRGRVVGVDSAQGGEGYVPIAGARLRVVLLSREAAPPGVDSSTVSTTRTEVGVTTSDAEGRFALAGVPSGYFA